MKRVVLDIEASNLLNNESIDYTASPYKIKDDYKVHLIVCKDIDTGEIHIFRKEEVKTKFPAFYKSLDVCIGHNIVNFDLLCIKLYLGINYSVEPDTIDGKPCEIIDTLVISKTLNPDRLGGHSLKAWGKRLGDFKGDFHDFSEWSQEMEDYCVQDVNVTHKVYTTLMQEKGTWNWDSAVALEKSVAEIITRQEHRGFNFDTELAGDLVRDLDTKIDIICKEVEPILPSKSLTKSAASDYTPPKTQFLKSGEHSKHLLGFIAKHSGRLLDSRQVELYGKVYTLPLPVEPLITEVPSTLKDTTHIKEWLVRDFGWVPIQYKERDLTVNAKKQKLNKQDYDKAVNKYMEQTLASAFCKDRLEHLEMTKGAALTKLLAKDISRPVKVLTNPTFTVGQDKEICPNLEKLNKEFPHTRKIVEFLTYTHRRNSILGGGVDPDEIEDEPEKGFLANVRADGRIPTPADTCGAGTSRFKHRVVANIPRTTSLYGDKMRSLFGAGENAYQIGYDFDSLEAKIEAHYCFKYEGGPEYGESLTAEKPNDCHTVLASHISVLIGKAFPRGTAKSVKYGCSYNAQAKRVAKIVGCDIGTAEVIFEAFWTKAAPLKALKENMQKYWETTGQKKFLIGIDGRKLPIRSKGNVINTAFQSAGVICAKKAMVLHDRKLKEHGFITDFFSENYKEKSFAQQMIAYHDEAQIEVTKDLVKFKMFKTEEEGKEFRKQNPTWGELGHTEKGWYSAYSLPGLLATQAVKESGEFYNLNVELTAGYIVAKNWYGAH
jgi:hypothetical protein